MTRRLLLFGFLLSTGAFAADLPFLTAFTVSTIRNDFTGNVGWGFNMYTVGASIPVTHLGRMCFTGNSQAHTVYLVNASNNTLVTSVSVNMASCTPGTFVYAVCSATLVQNTSYEVFSAETSGGDTWSDLSSTFTIGPAFATFSGGYYSLNTPPNTGQTRTSDTQMYVPGNFTYTGAGGAATPYLTLLGVGD